MILWTIQTAAAALRLERTGTLRADGRRISKDHRPAYRWIVARMRERIGRRHRESDIRYGMEHLDPALAAAGIAQPGPSPGRNQGARIEFEVAKEPQVTT